MRSTHHLTEVEKRFKRVGLRITPQRVAIYDLLRRTSEHPTAQTIYEQLKPKHPSLSLMTVYNTLNKLVQVGLVNDLGSVGDGFAHFDADTSAHINLACTNCNQIVDVETKTTKYLSDEISNRSGFQIMGNRLMFFGICPACLGKTGPIPA